MDRRPVAMCSILVGMICLLIISGGAAWGQSSSTQKAKPLRVTPRPGRVAPKIDLQGTSIMRGLWQSGKASAMPSAARDDRTTHDGTINPARTITVSVDGAGADYASVQDAIDSITDDSTWTVVLVYPGTYEESVVCNRDNVILKGITRGASVIHHDIVNPAMTDGDFPLQITGQNCRVENLKLTNYQPNPPAYGVCIAVGGVSGGTVTDCTISGCDLVSIGRDTLYFLQCTYPVVEYCTINGYNHVISDNTCTALRVLYTTLINRFPDGAPVFIGSPTMANVYLHSVTQIGGSAAIDAAATAGTRCMLRVDGYFCDGYLRGALLMDNVRGGGGRLYYNNVNTEVLIGGTRASEWTAYHPPMWARDATLKDRLAIGAAKRPTKGDALQVNGNGHFTGAGAVGTRLAVGSAAPPSSGDALQVTGNQVTTGNVRTSGALTVTGSTNLYSRQRIATAPTSAQIEASDGLHTVYIGGSGHTPTSAKYIKLSGASSQGRLASDMPLDIASGTDDDITLTPGGTGKVKPAQFVLPLAKDANPTTGSTWFDPVTNQLGVYNGAAWMYTTLAP